MVVWPTAMSARFDCDGLNVTLLQACALAGDEMLYVTAQLHVAEYLGKIWDINIYLPLAPARVIFSDDSVSSLNIRYLQLIG